MEIQNTPTRIYEMRGKKRAGRKEAGLLQSPPMSPSKAVVIQNVAKATLQKPCSNDRSCKNEFLICLEIMADMNARVAQVRTQMSRFGREKIRRYAHSDAIEQVQLKK